LTSRNAQLIGTRYNDSYVQQGTGSGRRLSMRHKGVPKIETLAATRQSPQRFRLRWDRGSKSFTDIDRTEVMRFALDLVGNGYHDPRNLGNVYGKDRRKLTQSGGTGTNEYSFHNVSKRYLESLDVTPGYLRRYRRSLETYAYPAFGDKHIDEVKV
jgi:hypothetical protein